MPDAPASPPERSPLKVLLTFDIEVWCKRWRDLDNGFPRAFQRYVYGKHRGANYALPKTLEIMEKHAIRGVFFVEPLFATRFGIEPLAEIVELIRAAGQEVQMHMHPEWVNEARPALFEVTRKIPNMSALSRADQSLLIASGIQLLKEAGVEHVSAFRAGGFESNRDTLLALADNGIIYDSSLNMHCRNTGMGLTPSERTSRSQPIGPIMEFPLSVFRNAAGKLRHFQIGSCSLSELTWGLRAAHQAGWRYFNVLSHNFETLIVKTSRPDHVVIGRFDGFCRHLSQHRDIYPTINFSHGPFETEPAGLPEIVAPAWANAHRFLEQVYRKGWEVVGGRLFPY